MIKAKLIFYIPKFNSIGGMEQWIYYLVKKHYKKYDITVLYKKDKSDPKQIQRLRKLVRCINYHDEEIECDKAFFCYNFEIINKVKSKEYGLFIHSDYSARSLKINIPEKITHIYAVSEVAKKGFEITHNDQLEKLKLKVDVLYNPIVLDKPKKVLKIISATRLTYEKGRNRMDLFNKKANELGYPIQWLVFSDSPDKINSSSFAYVQPTLDISGYIKEADYLAQLSTTEAFGYSPVESLLMGIPLLITDMPIVKELKIEDGEHGYILPFELFEKGTDKEWKEYLDKICNNVPKGFKYSPPNSDEKWINEVLGEECKTDYNYEKEMKKIVEVEVIKTQGFADLKTNQFREYESIFKSTRERADYLESRKLIKIIKEVDSE